jgi:hypothetical protein
VHGGELVFGLKRLSPSSISTLPRKSSRGLESLTDIFSGFCWRGKERRLWTGGTRR